MFDTMPRLSVQHRTCSQHTPQLFLSQIRNQQLLPSAMTSQSLTLAQFLNAKADFMTMAWEAKAMDGIINGHQMEEELVSGGIFI